MAPRWCGHEFQCHVFSLGSGGSTPFLGGASQALHELSPTSGLVQMGIGSSGITEYTSPFLVHGKAIRDPVGVTTATGSSGQAGMVLTGRDQTLDLGPNSRISEMGQTIVTQNPHSESLHKEHRFL